MVNLVLTNFTITKPTSISSLKISSLPTKLISLTRRVLKIILDQLSSNETGRNNNQTAVSRESITSKDRNNINVPELSQVINNSRKSQNNVMDSSKDRNNINAPTLSQVINKTRISKNTATNIDTNQKNKSADANNEDTNLAVKPVIPKETKKNIKSLVKNIQPAGKNAGSNQIVIEGSTVNT